MRTMLRTCHQCGRTFARRHFRDIPSGAHGPDSLDGACSACYLHPVEDWKPYKSDQPALFEAAA